MARTRWRRHAHTCGAHEVDDRHAEPARGPGEPHVELREVDEHQHARPPLPELPLQGAERLPERGQAANRLRPADDGDALGTLEDMDARRGHLVPAHSGHPEARFQRRERPGQRGSVQIPGGLAGDHEDVNRRGIAP